MTGRLAAAALIAATLAVGAVFAVSVVIPALQAIGWLAR